MSERMGNKYRTRTWSQLDVVQRCKVLMAGLRPLQRVTRAVIVEYRQTIYSTLVGWNNIYIYRVDVNLMPTNTPKSAAGMLLAAAAAAAASSLVEGRSCLVLNWVRPAA